MQFVKKHKKFLIVLSVLLVLFITLIILLFTVFSLKKVDVELETEYKNLTPEIQLQIADEINLGGTVFFKNKDEIIKNIEKKYPYAKVVNIETVFPNKFVIHLAEREELYAISNLNKTCILDSDLKILKIEDNSFISTNNNPILLNFFDLEFYITQFKVGQFLNLNGLNNEQDTLLKNSEFMLNNLISCFQINNKNSVDLKALFKNINFETYVDYRSGEVSVQAVISDFNDFQINILSPMQNLEDKIGKMLYAYEKILTENPAKLTTHSMTVFTNTSGENLVIIEEKV